MNFRNESGGTMSKVFWATLAASIVAYSTAVQAQEQQTNDEPSAASDSTQLPSVVVETTPKKKKPKPQQSSENVTPQAVTPSPQPPSAQAENEELESATGPVNGYVAKSSATGTKTDTPIIETPQSISVVTADQMEGRGVKRINEALQYTPGVYTDFSGTDPRFNQLKIRGFNAQGLGEYRDGLRQGGDPNNFAHFRNEVYGLERIDVIRGPSSVLYGQNAPGGLFDMITKRPSRKAFGEVVGQVGTHDRFQGAFDMGGALGNDSPFSFRLTGVVRESDAQIDHYPEFVKDDREFIAPALTWQPNSNTKLTILGDYMHDVTGHAFPIRQAVANSNEVVALPIFAGDPNFHEFDQEQFRVGYLFEHRFNEQLMVRQKVRYGEIDLDYKYLTGFGNPAPGDTATNRIAVARDDNLESFAIDNQIHGKIATGALEHTVLAGLDYQRIAQEFSAALAFGPPLSLVSPIYGQPVTDPRSAPLNTLSSQQESRQLGVYLQDQIRWNNWIATLGGRYDWAESETLNRINLVETEKDDEAFTGRAGLSYVFDFGLVPYVSYSESFLPTSGTDFFGNPFDPTTGQQYEAGVKLESSDKTSRLTLAWFDLTQQNVITPDTDPTHIGFNVQTGEITSRGFEAEFVATLTRGLNVTAAYTYQDVEVTKSNDVDLGKVPTLVPEHLASIFADYTFQSGPLVGFGFGAGVRYIGSTFQDDINTAKNDDYAVADAALHYTFDDMKLALNVSNLFNHEQGICSTAGCQWISPQIVTGTVSYRW